MRDLFKGQFVFFLGCVGIGWGCSLVLGVPARDSLAF